MTVCVCQQIQLLLPVDKGVDRPRDLGAFGLFLSPTLLHCSLCFPSSRYLFALQIKHDLACGLLICNDTSAALMVSHIIQCECSRSAAIVCALIRNNSKRGRQMCACLISVCFYINSPYFLNCKNIRKCFVITLSNV